MALREMGLGKTILGGWNRRCRRPKPPGRHRESWRRERKYVSWQANSRRRVRLGLVPLCALLASCTVLEPSSSKPTVPAKPPPAVAPPDSGVPPPAVRLLTPGIPPLSVENRPQNQLTAWSRSMSQPLNIPQAALQAYGYAARSAEVSHPGCGLSWPVLAGIGAIETSHGRYGGTKLNGTGHTDRPIRGLPLNGLGVRAIPDTDGGKLDGDRQFDRAVGPLQFIPATWSKWSEDADGDGVADPDDIDDAAQTAATYLCSTGGDLRHPDSFWKALLTYNQSQRYGQDVLDHADQYGRQSRELPVRW